MLQAATGGGLALDSVALSEELAASARVHDLRRPNPQVPNVELVKGGATREILAYLDWNRHVLVALMYLDFDLNEPTLAAFDCFRQRMPKGTTYGFNELTLKQLSGKTLAGPEPLGIRNLRMQHLPLQPQVSLTVLEWASAVRRNEVRGVVRLDSFGVLPHCSITSEEDCRYRRL
jgi:hypothetical protein